MGSIYQLHVIPSGAGVRDLLNKVSEWKKYDCKRNSTKWLVGFPVKINYR